MAARVTVREVDTPLGPARVHVRRPALATGRADGGGGDVPAGTLLLGHGAGGGIGAPDLAVAQTAALATGWVVGLVEQPWRVAGKRVASPPPRLDEAWSAVVRALAAGRSALPWPFAFGGRSAGARVACRLAGPLDAVGVLCLAFPLHPPGRPDKSRVEELAAGAQAGPVLVVQGERDPFGSGAQVRESLAGAGLSRAAARRVTVLDVPGDHSLRAIAAPAADPIRQFLTALQR